MGASCSSGVEIVNDVDGIEDVNELKRLVTKGNVNAAKKLFEENEEVVFDRFRLRDKGGAALGAALASSECRVKTLSLRDCQLCGTATRTKLKGFCSGLRSNMSLEWLDLSGNSIDDYSGQNLAHALSEHRYIKVLDLSRNLLGWNGGGAAYRALSLILPRSEITELKLGKNPTEGLSILVASAIHAPNLKALRLNLSDGLGQNGNPRSYCESCQSIGYRGRQAAKLLAKARPDLAVSFSDKIQGSVHLNATEAYATTTVLPESSLPLLYEEDDLALLDPPPLPATAVLTSPLAATTTATVLSCPDPS